MCFQLGLVQGLLSAALFWSTRAFVHLLFSTEYSIASLSQHPTSLDPWFETREGLSAWQEIVVGPLLAPLSFDALRDVDSFLDYFLDPDLMWEYEQIILLIYNMLAQNSAINLQIKF